MALQGKGFFTNNLLECESGDAATIAQAAQSAGLRFVILKIAEGTQPAGLDPAGKDLLPGVVQALKIAGISPWGWHSLHGTDSEAEARLACERVSSLGLEGYVINAEAAFELPGRESVARQFMASLRPGMKLPIALCSYQFPTFHPDFPWSAFLEGCDLHMPKVFWELAHNAGEQLRESRRQCDSLPNARPYLPVGAAYRTTVWAPAPGDINDFLNTALEFGLAAAAFFQWDQCRQYLPKCWEAAARFPWPVPAATPAAPQPDSSSSDPFSTLFLERLNTRQPDQIAGLYDPTAVRTWMDETQHGQAEIHQAYAALFEKLPPGMTFHLSGAALDHNIHHLSWTAGQICGETTLVMKNGKIVQDYTFIT